MLIMTPVEAIHYELMRTRNQLQAIDMIELLRNVLAKGVPGTSGGRCPSLCSHRDLTRGDHTWDPHEALLVHGPIDGFGPSYPMREIDHHASRKFSVQLLP